MRKTRPWIAVLLMILWLVGDAPRMLVTLGFSLV